MNDLEDHSHGMPAPIGIEITMVMDIGFYSEAFIEVKPGYYDHNHKPSLQ